MTVPGDILDFFQRAVPWPVPDGSGFVNLHWLRPGVRNPSKMIWSGRACRGPQDLIQSSQWALGIATIRDQYFCLSLQRQVKVKNGKIVGPERLQANAMALRSLWMDVDVDSSNKAGKGYPTQADALDAINDFISVKKLPFPSALVASGSGGVHVYWFSVNDLLPAEWQPLAEGLKQAMLDYGLKADAGCTIDSARVLRVPGSRNYKQNPPTDVRILGMRPRDKDYDLQKEFAHLAAAPPATATFITSPTEAKSYFDPALFPKREPVTESLSEGIEKFDRDLPLDPKPLMKECAFLRDALLTGGQTYAQPLWNLTTLCATFIEKGDQLAHALGNKHPGYTKESTDELYARKMRERKEKGLGWPSCKTIRDNGCTACSSCPHFAKGKTPLHLTTQLLPPGATPLLPSITATVTPSTALAAYNLYLPPGYTLNAQGYVCKEVMLEQLNGPPVMDIVQVLATRIYRPFLQKKPSWVLCFTAEADVGHMQDVQIPFEEATDACKALVSRGVMYVHENKRYVEGFVTSWMTTIKAAQEAVGHFPLGWYEDEQGKQTGFIYGNTIFMNNGVERPAAIRDSGVRAVYTPCGDPALWWQALRMVLGEGRPELEACVATGFAGPLMRLLGTEQVALSVWGSESGARKSTAVRVGSAIWANHKQARESAKTTSRSVMEKLGYVRHLTLLWDEVKDADAQKNTYDVCFGQDGIGPGRLNRDISQREKAEWQTMLVICANISFNDYVVKKSPTHSGGIMRCLEFEVKKPPHGSQGEIDTSTADLLMQDLEHNFGHVGLDYAKLLAHHTEACRKVVKDEFDVLRARLDQRVDERRWIGAVACIVAGATLGNQLGCHFNVDAIREFMCRVYLDNREHREREHLGDEGLRIKAENLLFRFLRDKHGYSVWTDVANEKPGRHKQALLRKTPPPNADRPPVVHWATDDRVLRIDRAAWDEYLAKNEIEQRAIENELVRNFGMARARMKLFIGTSYVTGQLRVMRFDVPVGSDLEGIMNAYNTNAPSQPVFQSTTATGPDAAMSAVSSAMNAGVAKDWATMNKASNG